MQLAARISQPDMLLVGGLAICFAMAFVAERIGLAGIVGAFAAGLLLDPYGEGVRTAEQEATLTHLLSPISSVFVPLFFVLMGIQVDVVSLLSPESVALRRGADARGSGRQARVRRRRRRARDQSARGRDWDGPTRGGGPHLHGDRGRPSCSMAAPSFPKPCSRRLS